MSNVKNDGQLTRGKIIAIRGVVVDVLFDQDVPNIYDALKVLSQNAVRS